MSLPVFTRGCEQSIFAILELRMNLITYSRQLTDLFMRQQYDEQTMDYPGLDRHIFYLKQLAIVENSSVAVVDLYKQRCVFVHSKYLSLLGVELGEMMSTGQDAVYSLMHPDDIAFVFETHRRMLEFLLELPIEERKSYKCIYDYRLKDKNGEYIRFIQQVVPLELDGKGNIWLVLALNDIVSGKDKFFKPERRIVHINTGKIHLFNGEDEAKAKTILSKREMEVLGLLANGLASKHIARELSLSVNTINNHRRNILKKTRSDNTTGAVRYAISLGLM